MTCTTILLFEGNLADSELLARFLVAAAALHSCDWLLALPMNSCGLRLDNDDESVCVAVSICLCIDLCYGGCTGSTLLHM